MNAKSPPYYLKMNHSLVRNKIDALKASRSQVIVGYIVISLSVFIGLWIRVKGLGKWPFDFDEYYIAASVKNILKYGLPRFDLGGYYVRGILIQYISTPLVLLGVKPEFALRIIPVIFNLLAIPPLYFLAKKISGKNLAIAVVAVFSLSLWEIEFSRFARMYVPFQTIFLWYLSILYLVIVERKRKYNKWLFVLSFVSIFVYEGSIFVALLNFLPPILNREKVKPGNILLSISILAFAILYLSIDFAHLGTTDLTPIAAVEKRSRIDMPPVIFISTLGSVWSYLFVLLLGFSVFVSIKIIKANEFHFLTKSALIILLAFSLMNLMALVVCGLVVLFILNWLQWNDFRRNSLKWGIALVTANVAFWIIYGLTTNEWLQLFQYQGGGLSYKIEKLFVAFLKYPNLYNEIIELYFKAMPIFTVISGLTLVTGIIYILKNSGKSLSGFRLLLVILIALALSVAILNIPWKSTRYTFFLFPIILMLVLGFIEIAAKTISNNRSFAAGLFFIAAGAFMIFSEDFNPHHFANIDSKAVNFRVIYGIDSPMANHIIKRRDVRGVAEYLRENMKKTDKVLTTLYQVGYYLNHIDYFYQGLGGAEAREYAASGGTKEKWMNADLIHDEDDLFHLLENPDSDLWVIINSSDYRENGGEQKIARKLKSSLIFQSYEGGINVYRIKKQNAG